jgi:hypothetical protein
MHLLYVCCVLQAVSRPLYHHCVLVTLLSPSSSFVQTPAHQHALHSLPNWSPMPNASL